MDPKYSLPNNVVVNGESLDPVENETLLKVTGVVQRGQNTCMIYVYTVVKSVANLSTDATIPVALE